MQRGQILAKPPSCQFPFFLMGAFFLKYHFYRTFHRSPVQKVHWTQQGTDTHSIDNSNRMEDIGLASMVDPCFSYLA
jgi:hypothetical protein